MCVCVWVSLGNVDGDGPGPRGVSSEKEKGLQSWVYSGGVSLRGSGGPITTCGGGW